MIEIKDKKDCCGCYSCVQKCPKHCIAMIADEEGFYYPKIDTTVCINCGLCESVCPQIHASSHKKPLNCYAIKHPSKEIQLASSSGGAFSLLAEYVLGQNGVVFGAAFDKDWNVVHKYIEDVKQLDELRMSKYVQSNIGNSFKNAHTFLKNGRLVLFVGTPCQIHALKLFLKKDYENLIAVDFVCHGVPSEKVWQEYLKQLFAVRRKNTVSSFFIPKSISERNALIRCIQFRNKRLGWEKFSFVLQLNLAEPTGDSEKNSVSPPVNNHKEFINETLYKNPYLRGFIHDLYLRPSCYVCKNKGSSSESDITLADFWGIRQTYPQLFNDKGISCVTINTSKGERFLGDTKIHKTEVDFKQVLKFNPSFMGSVKKPPFRNYFFKLMHFISFRYLVLFGLGYNKILRLLSLK